MEIKSFLIELIICFILSFLIGIERQYRRRIIGLRTIILVSLGSFFFVKFSFAFPDADATRIAAQIVAGIGFLGAGVIIKDGKSVKGLTTAATLWCTASIGVLCSANLLFEAAIETLTILFTNIILRSINKKLNAITDSKYNNYLLSIICYKKDEAFVLNAIKKYNELVSNIEVNLLENNKIKICINIIDISDNHYMSNDIMKALSKNEEIISLSLNKYNDKTNYIEEEY